ncbi:MAG: hypothetical protein QOD82_6226, partial [Pseudonocardiales bacterium]|nr:hypothetical protein [Pseudonocardiales bacterium]
MPVTGGGADYRADSCFRATEAT